MNGVRGFTNKDRWKRRESEFQRPRARMKQRFNLVRMRVKVILLTLICVLQVPGTEYKYMLLEFRFIASLEI